MAESSPFPYHGPLSPGEVHGRAALRRDLKARLEQHRLTALLGPRRYGKTSVLRQVTADLGEHGTDTVWVDLYELSSMADLAAAFDRGLAGTKGALRTGLDQAAGAMSLSIGVLGIQLAKGPRDRPEPVLKLRAMLQLLVTVAQRRKLILVLDEFSGIVGVDHAAGVLRTELQHHYRDLGIAFAGSQPSTMTMLFSDRSQPFFAQADLLEIGPLTASEVEAIIRDGFDATDRQPGPIVGPLVALAEGHPQRAMQLADAVWRRVRKGRSATPETWELALADVRASVDSGSERLFQLLPTGHQKVLRAVAAGGSPYGTAGGALSLSPGTARAGIGALLGSADLVEREGHLRLVDPLFADWIRRRFPV